MTPYYNTIAAVYQAQLETLQAIDTEGLYACLDVGCCGNDTQMFTNLFVINALLAQYGLSGELPVWSDICCNPVCGDLAGLTSLVTPGESSSVAVRTSTGTLTQGRIYFGDGTLAAGTVTIAATWVTAATRITATYSTASAAGQVNISVGTITPATSFVINGEGTNTFHWIAVVPDPA